MITWNYRVFRENDGDYIIREVFYAEDGTVLGCTANAVEPFGRTVDELASSIADFQAALTLPVLTMDEMPQTTMPRARRANGRTISSADVRALLDLPTPATIQDKAS